MTNKTCWVTIDTLKYDFSPAEEFGDIKTVFPATLDRDYLPDRVIDYARSVLEEMEEGDYIIMAGDPTLYAIAVAVALENFGYCNVLRWGKKSGTYEPMTLDFRGED
jgi:hypothetical protein